MVSDPFLHLFSLSFKRWSQLEMNSEVGYCIYVFMIIFQVTRVNSRLIAAAVIPHGDFAYDPTLLDQGTPAQGAAEQVARAARRAGTFISNADPDIVFLSTPHGIELTHDFGLYLGSHARGYATIGSDLANSTTYKVHLSQINLAPSLSDGLMLKLSNESVSGVLPFADSEDMPLRWGEVIPLLMIPNTNSMRQHIIWSHPLRRYTQASEMVPELVRLGGLLFEWAEATPLTIAIVISSDLSHTHQADGPYGYSNASESFDHAVGEWAANPCHCASSLLKLARSLQDNAKSCGFTGLVLLHGALCRNESSHDFDTTLIANRNVTYYGMMAATFKRRLGKKVPDISLTQ
jgi:aromatic ring-opening dioxygenase LigB subunit